MQTSSRRLPDPYVIARDGASFILMGKQDALARNRWGDAQLYDPETGRFSPVKPLQELLKFLYSVVEVEAYPFNKEQESSNE